jgi:uncharacterized protein with PIN domain
MTTLFAICLLIVLVTLPARVAQARRRRCRDFEAAVAAAAGRAVNIVVPPAVTDEHGFHCNCDNCGALRWHGDR